MSEPENTLTCELLVCSDPMMLPWPIHGGSDRVYDELNRLATLMPQRYADVFRFRWGLDTHFPHLASQVARKFEIPKSTIEEMLNRCLWNVARYAHQYEMPTIRKILGDDRDQWAARAWQQAERRWGNEESNFSETVLLLAAGGLDVPDAHRHARQHMREMGMGEGKRWPKPLTPAQRVDTAKIAVDRILGQIIWPSTTKPLQDLDAFSVRRPLRPWAPAKSGVFPSEKLGRLVQFDSELELLMLRQFDTDPRIIDYKEQPLTIPYSVGGEDHEYTPDVILQLDDGRAFVVEMKPSEFLGDFTNWMKWASLARWCAQHGVGFWIGSPQRSLTEHVLIQPDSEKHDFVLTEVGAEGVTGDDYTALQRLVGCEQLGLVATTNMLDWRADQRHITQPISGDLEVAQRLKLALLRNGACAVNPAGDEASGRWPTIRT